MLRNRVFRVRKIRILSVIISIIYFSEIVFSGAKHSNRSSTILQNVRFADVQESRFQGVKRSNLGSALQQLSWFADSQESLFYAAKRWDIGIAIPQEGRFANAQDSRFQAANVSNMGIDVLQEVQLGTSKKSLFSLWYVQICAVTCYNKYDLLMTMICVFSVRKFRCVQWLHETNSICWCRIGNIHIWVLMSCLVIDFVMYRIAFWNGQNFWYGLCHPARGSIWWCSEIEF